MIHIPLHMHIHHILFRGSKDIVSFHELDLGGGGGRSKGLIGDFSKNFMLFYNDASP